MGRLVGLLALEMKKSICETYISVDESCSMDITYWSESYRWMIRDCKLPDPGTYAVIGMASFMGGSGRITVMLATVILELTADADMIAPVGITCVIAMLIGNMFNHGLYHGLIPIMNIPYLNARPAPIMFVSRVRDIMHEKIVWLPQHCHIGELKMLLKRIEKAKGDPHHVSHHAFPVVTSSDCHELQGCISRSAIYQCVKEYSDTVRRRIITHPTTNRIDVSHYMDRGPLTVFPHTTVAGAYSLFRKLGLRHLPVVARDGTICGMVTRKDLMLFKLVTQHERELQYVIFLQKLERRRLKASGFYARTGIKMSPDGYSEKQSDHDIMAL